MCMNCVSQSLPYVALALGGLQLPRLRGWLVPTTGDEPSGDTVPTADTDGAGRQLHEAAATNETSTPPPPSAGREAPDARASGGGRPTSSGIPPRP